MAKIPERTVSSTDRARLQDLDTELKEVVYGQDTAIDAVCRAIKLRVRASRIRIAPSARSFLPDPRASARLKLRDNWPRPWASSSCAST